MHVWQSSLLPPSGIHKTGYFSKHLDILDDMHNFLNFLLKHPGNQVNTICYPLSWKQFNCYIWSAWVAGEGDEEIRCSSMTLIGHSILCIIMHVTGPSSEG
ncbi:hypothetical protein TNCT_452481 [Trichonephila clavata]|uniref:Uncharacterized protein n=1 Tax=Trichonephila clavata TaxID=2740835 RepID=A0A8X6G8D4_TRICU|nr:hypothetical protein TNCT_452481 [Trichonephila clavata]